MWTVVATRRQIFIVRGVRRRNLATQPALNSDVAVLVARAPSAVLLAVSGICVVGIVVLIAAELPPLAALPFKYFNCLRGQSKSLRFPFVLARILFAIFCACLPSVQTSQAPPQVGPLAGGGGEIRCKHVHEVVDGRTCRAQKTGGGSHRYVALVPVEVQQSPLQAPSLRPLQPPLWPCFR